MKVTILTLAYNKYVINKSIVQVLVSKSTYFRVKSIFVAASCNQHRQRHLCLPWFWKKPQMTLVGSIAIEGDRLHLGHAQLV